jgi:aminoglycoside phosphotransferase
MIDLGHLGVAGRHQDIAIFLRSAARNHPQIDACALLQEHYPGLRTDEKKLRYYRLLDEFF